MTVPFQDPFANPAIPPSTFPSVASLRGRLITITPRKIETVPSKQDPTKMQERVAADVSVLDGLGPVPICKGNPATPTGQFLDGPDFTGVYFNGQFMVEQLRPYIGTGTPVLGVVDTKTPGTHAGQGNPWGIVTATPEQRQQAVNFLNSRAIGAAAAPAPQTYTPMQATPSPTPVYGQPTPQNPFAQTSPQPAAPAGYPQQAAPITTAAAPVPEQAPPAAPAPYVPAPGSAPANVNPFASFA